ncbi:MAG: hypothetical protein GXP19_06725 [Gammaproteobacteria bacterium]|nr:hypothetical protein [Gammaproteobacteria bacterium]
MGFDHVQYFDLTVVYDAQRKKRLLKQQYAAINKQDGIDKDEAMIIARHYVLVETTLSRIHRLGDEIINDGDHWVIDLFNPLSSREITKEEIILMVILEFSLDFIKQCMWVKYGT